MIVHKLEKFRFRMGGDWENGYLIDLMEFQRGFDLPESGRIMGAYPVIASTGLVGYHNNYKVKAPGLVIGRSGSLGGGQFLKENFWPLNTTLWVKDFKGNNQRYCYYYIKNIDLTLYNSGCGVPTLNRNHIHKINLLLLKNLATQKKIAGVLAAFDELIEVNRRKIKILEEMAQAVYNEWFVKMRFPGHEKYAPPIGSGNGTAPYRVFDSPLGPIPEAWDVLKLKEIADEFRENVHPKNISSQTAYVGLEHIPRVSLFMSEFGLACEVASQKLCFRKNDILFGKIRPYFHKVVISNIDGVCSTDIFVIRPFKTVDRFLVLNCVFSKDFVNMSSQTSQGTKMPRANWDVISSYLVARPDQQVLENFNTIQEQLVEMGKRLVEQNWILSSLRDLLLPKLISGKIDVSELDIDEYALGDC